MSRLLKKNVLLGVTGSIAAYKACLVLRQLQTDGAQVKVMMTRAAQEFVGKSTFEALTQQQVMTDLFPDHRVMSTEHIHLAEWAHAVLICPATANCIGKAASGIADDFLTTVIAAARTPVLFAPAMDAAMCKNPVYLMNCDKLRSLGYHILKTETGRLASGLKGGGRLASTKYIVDYLTRVLTESTSLQGKKVLISAGPTREYIDDIRFISNPSSGKMGIALAEEAYLRGAEVTMVTGPIQADVMDGIERKRIESAEEMAGTLMKLWPDFDILIMAAAVADYRPAKRFNGKIKKQKDTLTVEFERTEDILSSAAKQKGQRLVVGFALETGSDANEQALRKLKDKGADLICLNRLDRSSPVFGSDMNRITLIENETNQKALPEMTKNETACAIWDKIESMAVSL